MVEGAQGAVFDHCYRRPDDAVGNVIGRSHPPVTLCASSHAFRR